MAIKKQVKVEVEDFGVVLKHDLNDINADYEKCAQSMLHYTSCTLNDALMTFRTNGRIDKIQLLQELIVNFMNKVLIEKQALNMEILHKECSLNPELQGKLENVLGKKVLQNPPKNTGDGNLKFNRG